MVAENSSANNLAANGDGDDDAGKEFQDKVIRTRQWFKEMPDKSTFVQASILAFMFARGAVDDANAVHPDELNQLEAYLTSVYGNMQQLEAMFDGSMVLRMVDGKPVFTPK